MRNVVSKWSFDLEEIKDSISGSTYHVNEVYNQLENRHKKIIPGIKGNAFLFDGYSNWAEGSLKLEDTMDAISVTAWILPRSFEQGFSGIISQCNKDKKEGFALGIEKHGQIVFQFGANNEFYSISSNRNYLKKYHWYHIAAIVDGNKGWATLYINGIEVNRLQFQKQTKVHTSNVPCYLGKYHHAEFLSKYMQKNIFSGLLNEAMIFDKALSKNEINQFYQSDLLKHNGHIPFIKKELIGLCKDDYQNDKNRPRYHLIASGHWMNEPHAPIYFEGKYHIFYQANPHGPYWSNIQWGHMISDDMVHWKELELALETEDNKLDPDGCWSGCCYYDREGIPAIFYTAGNNSEFPNQMVALATSDYLLSGDIELKKWNKHTIPLIRQSKEVGWQGEFRDPFVWKEGSTWFMLVGTGDANYGGGNAAVYTSEDMYHWIYHNMIIEYTYTLCEEVGHVWELPVLLPVQTEDKMSMKYILLFCACQVDNSNVETYYWIGNWDKESYRFIPEHEKPMLFDLGNGTFSGGCGLVTPDRKSVIFTIAQGKRTMDDDYFAGWAHNGGIPIELYLKSTHQLGMKPIHQLKGVRKSKIIEKENATFLSVNEELKNISGNMYEIVLYTKNKYLGIEVQYTNKDTVEIYYDKETNHFGAKENDNEIAKFRDEIDLVTITEASISMHFFLDYSMIECFLNYQKTMTLRNYTKDNDRRIKINGEGIINHITMWELSEI